MKVLGVLVDSREKYPILFPETTTFFNDRSYNCVPEEYRVKIVEKSMEVGDYALEGFESECVIERKGSVGELHSNLHGKDYARFTRAISRLAECSHPILLLDFTPAQFFRTSKYSGNTRQVFDSFFRVVLKHGLHLWWAGGCGHPRVRRILGEQLLHAMLVVAREKR